MPNATTIRLDPALKKAVMRLAKERGLSLSDVIKLLLHSFLEGTVDVGVTRYPDAYAKMIKKELRETKRLVKEGKIKSYTSVKEMFDDLLQR